MIILNRENRDVTIDGETYIGRLLQQAENQPLWWQGNLRQLVAETRRRGGRRVAALHLPTKKDEEWRFTDLSDLYQHNWHYAIPSQLNPEVLAEFILPPTNHSRLVLENGYYQPPLSDVSAIATDVAYLGNLGGLREEEINNIASYLAKEESEEGDIFAALNSAGLVDALVVWVKANQTVSLPLHLLHITVTDTLPRWSQPRILVVVEENSVCELIECYGVISNISNPSCSYTATGKCYYFNNAVTEIYLKGNARINHTRIQMESGDGFHIAKTMVYQFGHSHYTLNEVSLGGKLYRHNLKVYQRGEKTETFLYGLTFLQGKQLGDTHSEVNLDYPHGVVNQLHKYIIDDKATGVFNGKIRVPKRAQLTNASQLNRNLLLSPGGKINTKPELQITADNVKCTHGATVSQLEAEEVFYLRSRGLSEEMARHLLIDAFAAEILDKIPLDSLKQRLRQCFTCRT
ncbi:MAG: Fe-S cluster assembly protein SufD [Geminocystis sp.]|nr:Fe-S cluster assembly protein SufD [Geminocystis sp.]